MDKILIHNFGWVSADKIASFLGDLLPLAAHWSRTETLYRRLCDSRHEAVDEEYRAQHQAESRMLKHELSCRIRRFIDDVQPSLLLTEAEK